MANVERDPEPTVIPSPSFDAEHDAKTLHSAVDGPGTDETAIIQVVCNRSRSQRQRIKIAYHKLYTTDLVLALKDDISGNFRDVVELLMKPVAEFEHEFSQQDEEKLMPFAKTLHDAMHGPGTDDDMLIKVIVWRCEIDLGNVKKDYDQTYSRSLATDVADDTSGYYRDSLLALIK